MYVFSIIQSKWLRTVKVRCQKTYKFINDWFRTQETGIIILLIPYIGWKEIDIWYASKNHDIRV